MRLAHACGGLAALVAVWQLGVNAFSPPRYILPSPVETVAAFLRQPAFLLGQGLVTLSEIVVGLMLGSLLGAAAAVAIAAFTWAGRLFWPLLVVLQALPVFVLAPVLVLWFGFGMASKVAMTTIIIFFPVASAFGDGLRRTDRDILDAVSLTQASHWQTLCHVRVPLALPSLVSGLRVAAPLAPLGAVVGEWVGASAGLGFVMVQANARMQTDTVFAAMAILAVFAVTLRLLVDRLTARIPPWAREADPVF
jgi:putative hydroxymethylpyrimidine transport system permease protein